MRLRLSFANGTDVKTQLFCTVSHLGQPFQGLADLQPILSDKPQRLSPRIQKPLIREQSPDVRLNASATGRPISLAAEPGLKFDRNSINVKAGERLTLTLSNRDQMPHNWVLVDQGSYQSVGRQSDQMINDPRAAEMGYVPDMPEVFASIQIVNPEEEATLSFNAPLAPGTYVYLCTYPGHWQAMRGSLIVY